MKSSVLLGHVFSSSFMAKPKLCTPTVWPLPRYSVCDNSNLAGSPHFTTCERRLIQSCLQSVTDSPIVWWTPGGLRYFYVHAKIIGKTKCQVEPSCHAALRLYWLHNITSDTGYNVAAVTSSRFGPTFLTLKEFDLGCLRSLFFPRASTFARNSPQFHSVWLLV